ncbi:MAG TPA: TonB-dependent receptor [Bryobacteraceae bacterium]|nr:TonB-dependent receptor [Bryobacteraceae bacterium]
MLNRSVSLFLLVFASTFAQPTDHGIVAGTVTDPSGAAIEGATVRLAHAQNTDSQTTTTDSAGAFRFIQIPENSYELTIIAAGFAAASRSVAVHGSQTVTADVALQLQAEATSVEVQASAALVEANPSAHADVDRSSFLKLPTFDPGGQLSQAVTYSTGGVAADANGFFHPLGDHAQTTFVIDGQPISDQQSKAFSTQIPANALEAMELITGSADAQYGDKSSLIVNATTRSALGAPHTFGTVTSDWGSFGTWGGSASFGFGGPKYGNFLVLNGVRSGHFLDTPEALPIHDRGNHEDIFDRLDWQPAVKDAFHLDLFTARNWFQAPNSYDQLSQDQRQRVLTWNIAPGYQRIIDPQTLLTANLFVRRDEVGYFPSRDPFADTPVTAGQHRFLTNYGGKANLSRTRGRHSFKFGLQLQQTRLLENFHFGITDPAYQMFAGLAPYNLALGGSLFQFHGQHNIDQYAFYATDEIRLGNFTVNAGLREDQYNGLIAANGLQPRLGIAYLFPHSNTVLRLAYARTFETPFNENLVLSSGTGSGGLAENVFGRYSSPIRPGVRNQFNAGFQQSIGRWLLLDADYFWKYTHNAYDFDVLFNTPITFPIAWHNSKLDGVTARASTINLHGFQAYLTIGHTRARYFPPENGGLIPLGGYAGGVFRIDHDQALQQTAVVRYQRPKAAEWIDFTWRYDSGLVVTGIRDATAALALTAAQQTAIGLACDGVPAGYGAPLPGCAGVVTSTLLTLPAPGTENDDHNPDRVKPRSLFNAAIGTDNLFHTEARRRTTLRLSVENLTNKKALYNFLSTFSGTHFVAPRTYQASVGYSF